MNLLRKSGCNKSCRIDCRDLQQFYFNLLSLVLEIVLVCLVRREWSCVTVCVALGKGCGWGVRRSRSGLEVITKIGVSCWTVMLCCFVFNGVLQPLYLEEDVVYPHSCDQMFMWICLLCFPLRFLDVFPEIFDCRSSLYKLWENDVAVLKYSYGAQWRIRNNVFRKVISNIISFSKFFKGHADYIS